jgi:hypothetical protein
MSKSPQSAISLSITVVMGLFIVSPGIAAHLKDDAQMQAQRTLMPATLVITPPLLVTGRVTDAGTVRDAQTQAAAVMLFRIHGPAGVHAASESKSQSDAQESARRLLAR